MRKDFSRIIVMVVLLIRAAIALIPNYSQDLLLTALIYLVMVMFFTWLVQKLERRLRNSER